MKEVKSHEISKSQERRTRSVKRAAITRDDVIDILVAISIISKRIAKRLNNENKEKNDE